jgi:Capsular polysaccharide synthesis protein
VTSCVRDVPKQIWILWTQGLDRMPPVPRACVESWTRCNPGWDVKVLTGESLGDWVDPQLRSAGACSQRPYRLSELARLNLLVKHGGVWADATCFCIRPLDEWLPECLHSGFFAFDRPGRDRVMASWLLASPPGGYIPRRLFEALDDYYLGRELSDTGWRRVVRRALDTVFNRSTRTTSLWFAWPLPRLGISPYLSFHYMFNRLANTDPRFRRIWEETVRVSADGPHALQLHGLAAPPSPQIIAELEQRRVPLYKLNWRIDPATLPASCTLNVLLHSATP